MNIDHLALNLEKRRNKYDLIYTLGKQAQLDQIQDTEIRLNVRFPEQLKLFYTHYNGLMVQNPAIEILSLDRLSIENNLIRFSVIDNKILICFDSSKLNPAKQWNIIKCDNGYVITLTFASFWSNKIWAWIDKKRKIWESFSHL